MSHSAQTTCPLCPLMHCGYCAAHKPCAPSLYTVNVVSIGYDVTCTVTRMPGGRSKAGNAHVVCTTREASATAAVREARRMVRIARHCGGM